MCFAAIPAILSVAGTAVSAAGAIAQGRQQAALAEAQAQALEQQAKAEQASSSFEAMKEARQSSLAQSSARAAVGASGLGFQGSPTAVLSANAAQSQLDLDAIRWGSTIRQNNLGTQAGISRMQGRAAKQAGMFGAAGAIVSGASQLYDPARALRLGQSPFAAGQGGLI